MKTSPGQRGDVINGDTLSLFDSLPPLCPQTNLPPVPPKPCLPSQGRRMLMSAIKLNEKSKNKKSGLSDCLIIIILIFFFSPSPSSPSRGYSGAAAVLLLERYTMFFSSSAKQTLLPF